MMRLALSLAAMMAVAVASAAQEVPDWKKAQATEVWSPVPVSVDAVPHTPPSDAIVLSADAWQSHTGGPLGWAVEGGVMTVTPNAGDVVTRESFCDVQLHLEWRTPETTTRDSKELTGQARNNSGVFLQSRYEVQILDSYRSETYPNGQVGAVYKQSIPLVNASRAPGEWQSYDIIFRAPKFAKDGKVFRPATITVLHNGVLVQDHFEIKGPTAWIGHPPYEAHGCAPLRLQDHGDRVSFRNIWIRKL